MREMFYVLLGYLSGNILFARIVPQMLCHVDVTRAGEDRNPGTFNAFVAAGPLVGTVVLLLELGKGFLPVHLALNHLQPEDPAFSLILLAPVIGHAWPLLHVKEGGKAIAVSFGVLLGMYPFLKPALLLAALYLLFSLVLVVRPNLYRSVLTFLCFAVGCLRTAMFPAWRLGCLGISAVVCWRHIRTGEREPLTFTFLPAFDKMRQAAKGHKFHACVKFYDFGERKTPKSSRFSKKNERI